MEAVLLTTSRGLQVERLLQSPGIRKSALEKVTLLQEQRDSSLVTLQQQGGLQETPTEGTRQVTVLSATQEISQGTTSRLHFTGHYLRAMGTEDFFPGFTELMPFLPMP